ncbi:MAG: alpha/beta fold hydrolase [Deltaproteobacteria bacterium]|nr:alpha/beta fold hydrolase [Deltaproteobacteria bacterium]
MKKILMNQRTSIRILVLFFLTNLFSISTFAADNNCAPTARKLGNLQSFIDTTLKTRKANLTTGQYREATHFDMLADQEAAQTWSGILPPKFIAELLPKDVTLIDHTLLAAAEPGVVKDPGSGEFLSLRIDVDGQGTNIGVSRSALLNNATRIQKSFVRDQAKAVILFMHGGGTRTTGHHVAINLMNHFHHYGVDVISFDHAWHGEGPRKNYNTPQEYMEWIRALIQKTVPADTPVFLAGHSMGGEFADVYRRLYPNDNLVKGVIALSTIVDPFPGASVREKTKLHQARDEETRSENSQSPEDKVLLQSLISQNKLSFPAFVFESLFSMTNSWVIPADGGKSLIPALYVWGEKDWLYVGNEKIIQTHLAVLPHTKIVTYGTRFDVTEKKDIRVGHMIFDHHRPGTNKIEVFADMQEFIEQTIGSTLVQEKPKSEKDSVIKRIVQTYANNLAFREFAKEYTLRRRIPDSSRIEELNKEIAGYIQYLNEFRGTGKKVEEDPKAKSAELQLQRRLQLRKGFFIPEGAAGDLGRQWSEEMGLAKKEELAIKKLRESKREELENLLKSSRENQAALEAAMSPVFSLKMQAAEAEVAALLKQMTELDVQIEKAIYEFYLNKLENPQAEDANSFLPPASLRALISTYEGIVKNYLQKKAEQQQILQAELIAGNLGMPARHLFIDRYGEALVAKGEKPAAGSIEWKEQNLRHEISEIDVKILQYEDRLQHLEKLLVDKYSDGLFKIEEMRLSDLLEMPIKDWEKHTNYWQSAWGAWQVLWKERPPAGKTSFY